MASHLNNVFFYENRVYLLFFPSLMLQINHTGICLFSLFVLKEKMGYCRSGVERSLTGLNLKWHLSHLRKPQG